MRLLSWIAAALFLGLAVPAYAQPAKPVKVALIGDKTGPLEVYAKQLATGFKMGLEYATKGSGIVAGRKVELIEKDSQTKPDVGRNLLAEAYSDDDADLAVGGTSSAVALAMLPVAQDYKKVLIVDGAVADSITGDKWNRYIFRVDRNSSQDAISNALSIGKPGVVVAVLAQDYAYGRDGVAAFQEALKPTGAKLVHAEFAPPTTSDFTAPAQRIFDALAKEQGEKILFVMWAGADPMGKIAALDPQRLGIHLATGGNLLPVLKSYKSIPTLAGMQGATYYYYDIPKNPVNDWLVAEHMKRFNEPPDFFTANGMVTALAVVAALEKTKGATDADTLISAMEGMAFDSPKGRVQFRAEDHQALQSMFGFSLKIDPNAPWAIPVLTREFKIEDMNLPITNKR
ncbi:substrate-binding domain-containing protein [Limobrevibacterium gyesilva]|uniref:Substrate-binding domain-containing protein n=1 Tax=Limobrevibacterium gyesilva TaxID=2991712 RepID=A0AA41YP08_9PROT|nr:substrate-binding domain-containing protein [Limobrevibacterium gyesilva]MCW3475618.1 substrate-binding domain-containing protein [Limobrevibacterium gyesilva]